MQEKVIDEVLADPQGPYQTSHLRQIRPISYPLTSRE